MRMGNNTAAFEVWKAQARGVQIEHELERRGFRLRRSGAELVGPCPKCGGEDRFAVHLKKQIFNCRHCDKGGDVIALVQLLDDCDFKAACTTLAGNPPTANSNGKDRDTSAARRIVAAEFSYHDESGKLAFVVERIEYQKADGSFVTTKDGKRKKTFRQKRPDGNGGWILNVEGVPPLLYRQGELIETVGNGNTVCIVEGEAKADLLRSWNIAATCCAMGAGKWKPEHSAYLRDADVVILPDNDTAGRKHVDIVGASLQAVDAKVRVLALPDLPDKGDIVDWAKAGGTVEKLHDLMEHEAKPWTAASDATADDDESLGEWDAGDDTEPPPPRGWLLGNIFCRCFLSSLIGEGGAGKSAVRCAQYLSLATGKPLTGEHVFQRCRVLIISLEDDANELRRRILAATLHHNIDRADLKGWLFLASPGAKGGKLMVLDAAGRLQHGMLAERLEHIVAARKIDLVALDPFVKTHSVEENSNSAIDDVVQILTDIATKYDIAVDTPHHTRKGAADPGDAERGRGASAMKDAGRLIYTLTVMTPEEAQLFGIDEEQRRHFVRMDSAKVNIAPPMAKAKWFHLIGVTIGNATELYPHGDNVQTVEPWTPPDLWKDADTGIINGILTEIDKGLPDGGRYSAASNAKDRAAWPVVTKHLPRKTEAQARMMVRTWVKNGLLVNEEYHDEASRRKVQGLRVADAKRPGTTT
jgi:hypothetical protein